MGIKTDSLKKWIALVRILLIPKHKDPLLIFKGIGQVLDFGKEQDLVMKTLSKVLNHCRL